MASLPIHLVDAPLTEPVISVDGFWPQPGLNLSHWPGNTTPRELKHALSTGIALAFVKLPTARQAELTRGCVALANNHHDTDGCCALFVLAHPDAALHRERALLDAAAAGDFFRFPSERAFAIDCVVNGLADPERSPLRARFAGLDDRARRELATREAVRLLPELLDGALEPFAELWKAPLERCLADRAALSTAARDELVHLDLGVWTSTTPDFAPGRHAFLGATDADRVLLLRTTAAGTTARFVVNTTSWFEIPGRPAQPRPDLEALAARLNALEGTRDSDEHAWRAQPVDSPSPELWFGRREHSFFAEHCAALAESRLDAPTISAEVVEALRAVWVFPEDA
ncbi:MAG: hypothetical protein HZA53_14590 [Planctomycetes bacterium]|nr:hypothetical protein [Planctomycetota bacterium]